MDTTVTGRARYSGQIGVSTAYGTFGELLQGVLPGRDGDFLVTLPIARWSMATFHADPAGRELIVRPGHKRKALRLAEMIIAEAPNPMGGTLTIESGLPEGKGLASSSADLVATARAVGNGLGVELSTDFIESLLRRIEPTDGVLYPGIAAYHHRSVRLRAMLGSLPPMAIVALDEGGAVDTIAFNRLPKPFSPAQRREYARLLNRLGDAVRAGDLAAVGEVATRSAVLNQLLRPKWTLDAVLRLCQDIDALGVVVTHSGTMLGVLLDAHDPACAEKIAAATEVCTSIAGHAQVYWTLSFA